MQTSPTTQNLTIKLACMMALIIIDVVINSFVESSFSLSFQSTRAVSYYFIFIMTFFIFIMVLILLWQTFPLRYGLLSILIKQFKWTFIVVLAFMGSWYIIQYFLHCRGQLGWYSAYSDSKIWNNSFYIALYYLRYLSYPAFYGFLMSFSLKIIDPSYYKPERWLK